jgi:hypothetical protein
MRIILFFGNASSCPDEGGAVFKKNPLQDPDNTKGSVSLGRRTLIHSILLTVGEVHQNLDNEKGGESRPSLF